MGCCCAIVGSASTPGCIGVGLTVLGFIESCRPCDTAGRTPEGVGGFGRVGVRNALSTTEAARGAPAAIAANGDLCPLTWPDSIFGSVAIGTRHCCWTFRAGALSISDIIGLDGGIVS